MFKIKIENVLKRIYKHNPSLEKKYQKEIKFRKKVERTYIKAGFTFEEARIIVWELFFNQLSKNKEINYKINLRDKEENETEGGIFMNSLQNKIIEEMNVKPSIDPKEEIRKSIDFMKDYLKKHPFLKGMVLGISGGQDSTLAGKLAQMAVDELNEEVGENIYSFYAVRLPYGTQLDEKDCQEALDFIRPTKTYTINIKSSVEASRQQLEASGITLTDFAKGNEKARERMKVQYSVAAMHQSVVLGTDHAAEAVTGFYTKFGDGGADLVPLFRLNKRQGKQMLKELRCPSNLYNKKPTADLEESKPGLPDEVALGVSYEEIDDYLEGKKISKESQEKIEMYYLRSQHKRNLPITIMDDFWK